MTPLEFLVPVEALEAVAWAVPYAVLVLVLANLVTRMLAHRSHKRAARDDAELTRYTPHVVVSALLVVVTLAFLLVESHGGMVLAVLVIGMLISDFFEFEARQVEARNGMPIEAPKGAIAASVFVLLYAAFQSLFWIIKGPWESVI